MFTLLRDLCRLFRSWWYVDRIRAPSSTGQLLRLEAGSLFEIAGRWWTVESRAVGEGVHGAFVRYRCHDGDAAGTLEVHPPPPFGSGVIAFTCGDRITSLDAAEIEVFARAP
jgi:hypothetical protein